MTTISSVFWLPFPGQLPVRIHACLDMVKLQDGYFAQEDFRIEFIYNAEGDDITEQMLGRNGREDLTLLAQQYHCFLHQEGLPRC